jgi:hypothetical protein
VAPRFSAPEWRGEQKHPRPFGDATSCMIFVLLIPPRCAHYIYLSSISF